MHFLHDLPGTAPLTLTQAHTAIQRLRHQIISCSHEAEPANPGITGQENLVDRVLAALILGEHCLLEGNPGLAKTLASRTTGAMAGLTYQRIQFMPDTLPSELILREVLKYDGNATKIVTKLGPLFTNLLLADEINRASPKTQAGLLEACEEGHATPLNYDRRVIRPEQPVNEAKALGHHGPFFGVPQKFNPLSTDGQVFTVMATQNPIEQEGTYPLPEAQLDRFMLSINISYPTRAEEREIVIATTQTVRPEINPVLQGRDILWVQQLVRQVPASQHMVDYAVDLVRATRPKEPPSPDFVKNWLAWGAGPRAAQNIILTAKARAILHGRFAVSAEDIRHVAFPVLRHRIFTNFNADAEGVDVEQVIEKILEVVPEPTYGETISAAMHARSRQEHAAAPVGEMSGVTPAPMPSRSAGQQHPAVPPSPPTHATPPATPPTYAMPPGGSPAGPSTAAPPPSPRSYPSPPPPPPGR